MLTPIIPPFVRLKQENLLSPNKGNTVRPYLYKKIQKNLARHALVVLATGEVKVGGSPEARRLRLR